MKRGIFFIVLVIITITCMGIGLYRNLGMDFEKNLSKNEAYEDKGRLEMPLEEFSSIKIKTSVTEIKIQEGEGFRIDSFYGIHDARPEYTIDNGTLTVNQAKIKRHGAQHRSRIILSVPVGARLDFVQIDSDVGDIEISDICGDNMKIDLNVGEIELENVDFNDINIENNVGEVRIRPAGNLSDYSLFLSTDVGKVNVGRESYKKVYEAKGDASKSISVDNNVGEITVK